MSISACDSDVNASTAGALVLYSGGQDSATCLAYALETFERVETVGFAYGQRHHVELDQRTILRRNLVAAFPQWARRLGEDHLLDLKSFGALGDTALTSDRAIEMTDRGLPSTYVPGRNLAFFVYAAALADRRGLHTLIGGMGEADYSGYPDCRRTTLDALERALQLGMERPFRIDTPLMTRSKAEVWAFAHALGGASLVEIIKTDSHTCYLGARTPMDGGFGCGVCPACDLRARGWRQWRSSFEAAS
jgi:7-cyano-7-deazaguanine synthase